MLCVKGIAMNIMITNDDGIDAAGLVKLAEAAKKYGQVTVVAPSKQQSGTSHSINLHYPFGAREVDFPVKGVKAFSADGSPADCVRLGILSLVDSRPDIVLSGVNFGYNSGTDCQYSGTIGAAMEAIFQGIPAIAFSEGFDESHSMVDAYLEQIMGIVMDMEHREHSIINVNFPQIKPDELKGILMDRTVSRGFLFKDHYNVEIMPDGTKTYMVEGVLTDNAEEGSDLRALLDGYISIGYVRNIG